MQELASATEEEIKCTAERILDGTHERRQSRASDQDAGNQAQEFEDFLNSITDDFKIKLIAIPRSRNPGKSKTALRAFINMLEDIYTRI